jgi:hypothetical protein
MITFLTENKFYTNRTFSKPINWNRLPSNSSELVKIFDQNGYRLTELETRYAETNNHPVVRHGHEVCLRQDWFVGGEIVTGAHLNHAFLFERKGYEGEALEQLKEFAKENNLIHKLINYKGKWGVDFSIDYVDSLGNSMEILHFEYDSYSIKEIQEIKEMVEENVAKVDWDFAAQAVLEKKHEWINLDFFEQSKWKTDYFGLPAERFKMNAWE